MYFCNILTVFLIQVECLSREHKVGFMYIAIVVNHNKFIIIAHLHSKCSFYNKNLYMQFIILSPSPCLSLLTYILFLDKV